MLVGGEICDVTSVTDEQITCVSPAKPDSADQALHMGGRGVLVEMLTDENALYNETDSERLFNEKKNYFTLMSS